ncbi:hypothetical protein V565_202030 [Rhizoctonia solani 123E]|uniref:Uncharacterized protein n=1 Tax=Rhizoctonia solani 123E TaxID=1423351 RepID=A0A074RHX2_9AGAM|nr:hypothetical protein V565_202030 [Rhizoctonia solani 123E]
MPPPFATPKKRARRRFSDKEYIPRDTPSTPPRRDWSSSVDHLVDTVVALWNDIPHPTAKTHLPAPIETAAGYHDLLAALIEVSTSVHRICDNIARKYDLEYQWQLPVLIRHGTPTEQPQPPPPEADQAPQPPPPVKHEPTPEPEPEPEPMPLSRPLLRSYAAAAALHVPRRQRQALPRHQPSTQKAKLATVKPIDPVRIVVQLADESTHPA